MRDYDQLHTAVCDLLAELRIDEPCLGVMAKGYSPDYPGVVFECPFKEAPSLPPTICCKVQLSKVVAQKLINAGINTKEE